MVMFHSLLYAYQRVTYMYHFHGFHSWFSNMRAEKGSMGIVLTKFRGEKAAETCHWFTDICHTMPHIHGAETPEKVTSVKQQTVDILSETAIHTLLTTKWGVRSPKESSIRGLHSGSGMFDLKTDLHCLFPIDSDFFNLETSQGKSKSRICSSEEQSAQGWPKNVNKYLKKVDQSSTIFGRPLCPLRPAVSDKSPTRTWK